MILVRLDPHKGATAVMSMPRDLKVDIPGHGADKINAAYAIGGPTALRCAPSATCWTSRSTTCVNVNFGGFRRAVDRLGCVYVDVDRRYFNDNSPPIGGGGALRDDRRQARLPEALRPGRAGLRPLPPPRHRPRPRRAPAVSSCAEAKDQIGVGKLFSDRKELLRIFGRYTQTDIASARRDPARC